MAGRIHRVTMFKLPEVEHQEKLIEAYKTLSKNQQKVSLLAMRLPSAFTISQPAPWAIFLAGPATKVPRVPNGVI
jgi:hypothetical protein